MSYIEIRVEVILFTLKYNSKNSGAQIKCSHSPAKSENFLSPPLRMRRNPRMRNNAKPAGAARQNKNQARLGAKW